MKGSTHLLTGVAIGLVVARSRGLALPAAVGPVAVAGLAALVPDWLQVNLPALNQTVRGVFGHRGFTHWLLTAGMVYLACQRVYPPVALFALAGWLSHLLLDALNPPGVPALWPLPWRVKLATLKHDGLANHALAWLAGVAILWGLAPYLGG